MPGSSEAPTFASETTHVSGRRLLAHLVDGVALTVVLIILLIPAALIADVLIIVVFLLWFTVGHIAYFALTQRRRGQSPGKRFNGLRLGDRWARTYVVDVKAQRP